MKIAAAILASAVALTCSSLVSATPADPDVTLCKIGDSQIRAEFHGDINTLNVEMTKPGRVQSFVGQSHEYANPDQIKKDVLLSGLVQMAGISSSQIAYASVSILSQGSDGGFMLAKFVDAHENTLAITGVNGMTPFRCQ